MPSVKVIAVKGNKKRNFESLKAAGRELKTNYRTIGRKALSGELINGWKVQIDREDKAPNPEEYKPGEIIKNVKIIKSNGANRIQELQYEAINLCCNTKTTYTHMWLKNRERDKCVNCRKREKGATKRKVKEFNGFPGWGQFLGPMGHRYANSESRARDGFED